MILETRFEVERQLVGPITARDQSRNHAGIGLAPHRGNEGHFGSLERASGERLEHEQVGVPTAEEHEPGHGPDSVGPLQRFIPPARLRTCGKPLPARMAAISSPMGPAWQTRTMSVVGSSSAGARSLAAG